MQQKFLLCIIPLSIVYILCACHDTQSEKLNFPDINPFNHTLMVFTPDFSFQITNTPLYRQYMSLQTGKEFPMVGVLRVDGKSYRFMGKDSLRMIPLVPLSNDSCGWSSKYTFLCPEVGWQQPEYNDSKWLAGIGAYGREYQQFSYPVHTMWACYNLYVRRNFAIDNMAAFEGGELYLRYQSDNQVKFYFNGEFFQEDNHTSQIRSRRITKKEMSLLHTGENLIAAYCISKKGESTLLDFGLYKEDMTYNAGDTATLKKIDVEASQTHYVFQCGDVELKLDFVVPSLLEDKELIGCPAGFITYQVHSVDGKQHDVEILFDVDLEWLFGNSTVQVGIEQGWKIVQSDSLYLGMKAEGTTFSCSDGHVIFSQKLYENKKKKGDILLLGYNEKYPVQFEGESLLPYWNKGGNRRMIDLLGSVGERSEDLKKECNEMDDRWKLKAFQTGGRKYAEKILPAYRSSMVKYRFAILPGYKLMCFGNSLGNVREVFDCFPFLLFYNRIDWMKGLLNPVFETCKSGEYVKKYPPYDIGRYPIARRQVTDDTNAIEAAANMLMMTLAIVKAEDNFGYAEEHWGLLSRWSNYLKENMNDKPTISDCLFDENGEQVKRVLGMMAYQELIQIKKKEK